jgi:enediyne biosynthesis protein E4
VDKALADTSYKQRRILYQNRGNGTFEDVSARSGAAIQLKRCSRGVAFGDIFNTGQTDILICNMNEAPSLLRNQMRYKGQAITIQLAGKAPNVFAIGARVTVQAKSLHMMNEIRSGGSYLSQSDLRLRFGLGDADRADKVTVRWPDGSEDAVTDLPGGHLVVIAPGGKILSSAKYRETPEKLFRV